MFKQALSYIAGFVFLVGIAVYLFMIISDLRNSEKHTKEEKFWIYFLFVLLVLGFFTSYYLISKSNTRIKLLQESSGENPFKMGTRVKFIGHKPSIPVKARGPLVNEIIA